MFSAFRMSICSLYSNRNLAELGKLSTVFCDLFEFTVETPDLESSSAGSPVGPSGWSCPPKCAPSSREYDKRIQIFSSANIRPEHKKPISLTSLEYEKNNYSPIRIWSSLVTATSTMCLKTALANTDSHVLDGHIARSMLYLRVLFYHSNSTSTLNAWACNYSYHCLMFKWRFDNSATLFCRYWSLLYYTYYMWPAIIISHSDCSSDL